MNAWPRCRTCMAVHAPDWAGCVASAGPKVPVLAPAVSENTGGHVAQAEKEPAQAVHEPHPAPKKPGRPKLHANGNKDRCAAYRERHSEAYKAANAERMRQKRSTARADQQQGDAA